MANQYTDTYKREIVSGYEQQWRDNHSFSIEEYSKQVCLHHTSIRVWLKKFAPEFDKMRREQHKRNGYKKNNKPQPQPPIEIQPQPQPQNLIATVEPSGQRKTQSVKVQTEWYEHTEHDINQEDLIRQLEQEIVFLRKQIAYWILQEPIV